MIETQMASLGDLLRLERRPVKTVPDAEYAEIGIYSYGRGIFHKTPRSGLEVGGKDLFLVQENDFIFQITFAWEGAVALTTQSEHGMYCSVRFPTFRVDESKCSPRYLLNYFRTRQGREQLIQISPGSAGRNRVLNLKRLSDITIPLPPLDEQQRIVARIEALAARIAEARGLRREAEVEAATLVDATYQHTSSVFGKVARRVVLAQVIESHDSGWSPQCEDRPVTGDEWGILKTTCVQWTGYAAAQNKALPIGLTPRPEIEVNPGDVLITRAGPVNRVGVACVVRDTPPRLMLSDKIVRVRPNADVNPRYLAIVLSDPASQEYFRQGKTGLALSQVNISREKLLKLPLSLPSLTEQNRLVEFLDEMQMRVEGIRSVQAETTRLIDALLPSVLDRAFRGEL